MSNLINMDGLAELLKTNADKNIVFTNGCFDILHRGHVEYLQAARMLGDLLIVGINDDASVRKLKGEKRPVLNLEDRILMLSALSCIDCVIPFSEDTPLKLIQTIKPNILVKGADYKKEDVVGAEYVESLGGKVELIPLTEGYSTTAFIKKIKEL